MYAFWPCIVVVIAVSAYIAFTGANAELLLFTSRRLKAHVATADPDSNQDAPCQVSQSGMDPQDNKHTKCIADMTGSRRVKVGFGRHDVMQELMRPCAFGHSVL